MNNIAVNEENNKDLLTERYASKEALIEAKKDKEHDPWTMAVGLAKCVRFLDAVNSMPRDTFKDYILRVKKKTPKAKNRGWKGKSIHVELTIKGRVGASKTSFPLKIYGYDKEKQDLFFRTLVNLYDQDPGKYFNVVRIADLFRLVNKNVYGNTEPKPKPKVKKKPDDFLEFTKWFKGIKVKQYKVSDFSKFVTDKNKGDTESLIKYINKINLAIKNSDSLGMYIYWKSHIKSNQTKKIIQGYDIWTRSIQRKLYPYIRLSVVNDRKGIESKIMMDYSIFNMLTQVGRPIPKSGFLFKYLTPKGYNLSGGIELGDLSALIENKIDIGLEKLKNAKKEIFRFTLYKRRRNLLINTLYRMSNKIRRYSNEKESDLQEAEEKKKNKALSDKKQKKAKAYLNILKNDIDNIKSKNLEDINFSSSKYKNFAKAIYSNSELVYIEKKLRNNLYTNIKEILLALSITESPKIISKEFKEDLDSLKQILEGNITDRKITVIDFINIYKYLRLVAKILVNSKKITGKFLESKTSINDGDFVYDKYPSDVVRTLKKYKDKNFKVIGKGKLFDFLGYSYYSLLYNKLTSKLVTVDKYYENLKEEYDKLGADNLSVLTVKINKYIKFLSEVGKIIEPNIKEKFYINLDKNYKGDEFKKFETFMSNIDVLKSSNNKNNIRINTIISVNNDLLEKLPNLLDKYSGTLLVSDQIDIFKLNDEIKERKNKGAESLIKTIENAVKNDEKIENFEENVRFIKSIPFEGNPKNKNEKSKKYLINLIRNRANQIAIEYNAVFNPSKYTIKQDSDLKDYVNIVNDWNRIITFKDDSNDKTKKKKEKDKEIKDKKESESIKTELKKAEKEVIEKRKSGVVTIEEFNEIYKKYYSKSLSAEDAKTIFDEYKEGIKKYIDHLENKNDKDLEKEISIWKNILKTINNKNLNSIDDLDEFTKTSLSNIQNVQEKLKNNEDLKAKVKERKRLEQLEFIKLFLEKNNKFLKLQSTKKPASFFNFKKYEIKDNNNLNIVFEDKGKIISGEYTIKLFYKVLWEINNRKEKDGKKVMRYGEGYKLILFFNEESKNYFNNKFYEKMASKNVQQKSEEDSYKKDNTESDKEAIEASSEAETTETESTKEEETKGTLSVKKFKISQDNPTASTSKEITVDTDADGKNEYKINKNQNKENKITKIKFL